MLEVLIGPTAIEHFPNDVWKEAQYSLEEEDKRDPLVIHWKKRYDNH